MTFTLPTYWVCHNHAVKGRTDNDSYTSHCLMEHEGRIITTTGTDDPDHPKDTVGPL